jgi:hypothetical protein
MACRSQRPAGAGWWSVRGPGHRGRGETPRPATRHLLWGVAHVEGSARPAAMAVLCGGDRGAGAGVHRHARREQSGSPGRRSRAISSGPCCGGASGSAPPAASTGEIYISDGYGNARIHRFSAAGDPPALGIVCRERAAGDRGLLPQRWNAIMAEASQAALL